jgi:putative DNA primase/helicase
MSFSQEDENSFLDAIAAAGLSPHKPLALETDGKIRRYRVADDKAGSSNGWYALYSNMGVYAGAFGSWKTGESHTWCSKGKNEISPAEKEALRLRYEQVKAERAEEQKKIWAETAKKADRLWNIAKPATAVSGDKGAQPSTDVHAYLVAKGIKPYGIKVLNKGLVVAARNAAGVITTLQFIQPDGSKRFLTGGEITGSYYGIGKPGTVLLVCEGFATGASLFEATGYAVAVAFNAGNLLAVCKVLREKFPEIVLIVCADNDQTTEGNPGLSKAQASAEQVGGRVSVPTFSANDMIDGKVSTDFNDYHRLYGLAAVKAAVDAAVGTAGSLPPKGETKAPIEEMKSSRMAMKEFEALIEDADDFDYLTDVLLRQIAKAQLKQPAVEALLSKIAKKADTTKASLLDEYKVHAARFGPNVPDQTSDDEVISTLNENHAVLPMGGRVVIMNREFDPVQGKKLITFSSKSDFELKYCNRKVYERGDEIGWGEYWLNHPQRAEYKGMVFLPGENEPGYLNLWQGWGVDPSKGDCWQYLQFVSEVICSGDDELYDYVINWAAHLVQRPQELPETALVFRGREGIGKNTFIEPLAQIVGREHYLMLSSLNQVTGRFSGHLANALLIFCNESVWGGDKSAQGVLKSMITDPIQPIEYKGRDLSMVKSFRRCIFATNEQWAVPRGADDRRYVITDVSDARKGDWQYFKSLNEHMHNGGTAALFDYLLQRDISDWHPRQIPGHILKRGWEMKIMSAGSVVRWWLDMLQQGYLYEADGYSDDARLVWPERCPWKQVEAAYLRHCNQYKVTHPEHSSIVGRMLHDWGIRTCRPRDAGGGRYLEYLIPSLDEAREIFSNRFGIPETYWQVHERGNAFA